MGCRVDGWGEGRVEGEALSTEYGLRSTEGMDRFALVCDPSPVPYASLSFRQGRASLLVRSRPYRRSTPYSIQPSTQHSPCPSPCPRAPWPAGQLFPMASPRIAMACLTSCEGRNQVGSGTIMLRMLKPDPMPAADRDGQPYLLVRTLPSVLRNLYSVLDYALRTRLITHPCPRAPWPAGQLISPYSTANACSSMALRKRWRTRQ